MLYLVSYGAGNVRSLANAISSQGFEFKWIEKPEDFEKADQLVFPGVGAFGQAMAALREKGFAEPLKKYIASGKPYFGICIGMQALFEASEEAPSEKGLGVVPASIKRFNSQTKAVPQIGWNGATPLKVGTSSEVDEAVRYGFVENGASYYFVHSYAVPYEERLSDWALTATQYGDETFISSVQKGNVFATQFHPEKSGKAGLNVLKAWLSQSGVVPTSETKSVNIEQKRDALAKNGFTKRVVACLDVRANDDGDLVVTKGDQYDVREKDLPSTPAENASDELAVPLPNGAASTSAQKGKSAVRNLGKPVDLARRYYAEGADEICFLNITSFRSCPLTDQPMLAVVAQSAETVFVPLTVGGGIRDTVDPDGTVRTALEVASIYFAAGADKVSIGSDAVYAVEELLERKKQGQDSRPTGTISSIESIAQGYGSQAVVVSVDPKRVYVNSPQEVAEIHRPCVVDLASTSLSSLSSSSTSSSIQPSPGPNGERYCWYQCTVKGGREVRDLDVVQLVQGVEELGAGEVLLNSVDMDGQKAGFDLRLVDLVKRSVRIPVVASSGAGSPEHFVEVFTKTDTEAALAAGIFHRREVPIEAVKQAMRENGIPTRKDL
ncbi:Imidazoleglycerol phosphate synthase [Cystobasidium minutum MCA 4210]|uniref:Imidazoleglycerol phosphate synthase n=1 Tax=Cystobasidium minutum MCA 4210 TaxID=1397322 RepID=UPI0034CFE4EE|eukprot:jgi/Rhomi1/171603/fgenesh1_kg.4_\